MQTNLTAQFQASLEGQEAEQILRSCVHCGFCNATCPTYQLLGDELDGPRGRIYQIKQVLEGQEVTRSTQLHLDRCLTCRNCETTCPSGVEYSRLLDIGRKLVEERVPRPFAEQLQRSVLANTLPRRWIFTPAVKAGQLLRPLLPRNLQAKLPVRNTPSAWPKRSQARQMLLLEGCVQPALLPNVNAATARVLDALGVQVLRVAKAGCCGALRHHLNQQEAALDDARRNIDAWWPLLQQNQQIEAIISNASGCGVMLKDYGHLLRHDAAYSAKAQQIASLVRDLSEVLPAFTPKLKALLPTTPTLKLAYHPPCTLQHGQQLKGQVETLMTALGFSLKHCADSHLCCGSAGTYSILQPQLATQLRDNKLKNLLPAEGIISANIGCQMHLQSGTEVPVRHWIEVLDAALHGA
ncbi:MAG: glycolate oxidase subunit GlcF [Burkholderiales bacterium]|nr:glycolate oxidase subunit GlcF [Burkholderiales bacterium]